MYCYTLNQNRCYIEVTAVSLYLLKSIYDLFIREREQLAVRPFYENIIHFAYVKYRCRRADGIIPGDSFCHSDLCTDCDRVHHSYNLMKFTHLLYKRDDSFNHALKLSSLSIGKFVMEYAYCKRSGAEYRLGVMVD